MKPCPVCGAQRETGEVVDDAMLDRALAAYVRLTVDPFEEADHVNAMREALAAALEVTP